MNLEPLLNPRSIAVLGASDRPSIGRAILASLDRIGFGGAIYPINPKYPDILGRICYPSLRDLPEPPDAVAFCVGTPRVLENIRALAERGGRAGVIYDAGFAERDDDGKTLQREITGICREAGIALCGPNCMGIINPQARSSTYIQEVRDFDALKGNVGLISQSGSICIGMIADVRRFGFSQIISSGNEAVVTAAAYLERLIDDPLTRVIGMFIESIREPERFVAALDRASAAGKPVIVLKVGRSERAQRAITTHTGGLAGESRTFSAVLRAHRAIEVADMDEMTELLAVCQAERQPTGSRLAVVTGSGGQAELILDLASASGLHLPPLPAASRAEAERVIGTITGDGNPLDAWGNGDYKTNMPHAFAVLNDNPETDAIVYCSDIVDDQPMGDPARALGAAQMLAEAAAKSSKPHYLMNMRSGLMNREQVKFLAERGIAVIGGSRPGLGAIARMAEYGQAPPAPRAGRNAPADPDALGRRVINEFDAKRILGDYGLPVTRERLVANAAEAKLAAHAIGYPVVLKAVADDLPHKSEFGLVEVGIADDAALENACATLQQRLSGLGRKAGLLVQEMVRDGVEMFAGISRDRDYGLSLAVGVGGVAIEVVRDVVLRMLPLREGEAAAMLRELNGARLLDAYRGRPAADVASFLRCIESLADFAWANRDRIDEVDLNPIKVGPGGSVIVDALLVTRKAEEKSGG